jgi:hypothetical protein
MLSTCVGEVERGVDPEHDDVEERGRVGINAERVHFDFDDLADLGSML